MSKKEKDQEIKCVNHIPLDALILDYKNTRYPLVQLIVHWAKVLKRQEGNQYLRNNDILEKAIKDIITGKVDSKTIEKEQKALLETAAQATKEEAVKEKLKIKEKETAASKKKK